MSLLVVGSIAIDSVQTPAGEAAEAMGGSASFFSYAASFFGPVRVVGVVGEDYPPEYLNVLESRGNIDTSGIRVEPGKTFRWKGRYTGDMNVAETLEVHLNTFGTFDPVLPENFRDSEFVFLANGSPVLQRKVLQQVKSPKLVVADTMNLWIEIARDDLIDLLSRVDGLVLNDQEALMLTQEKKLVIAGMKILEYGPKFVVVKKGEHGAMLFGPHGAFSLPAFPTGRLVDPTGAGDTFAGGLIGYLANHPPLDPNSFKRGLAYGTVLASLTVEDFSLRGLIATNRAEIDSRFQQYREMLRIPE